MTRNYVERLLDLGKVLGVQTPMPASDRLGWILVSKQRASANYLAALTEDDDDYAAERQRAIQAKPFLVSVIEQHRKWRDSPSYDEEFDRYDQCRFATINDVEQYLSALGYSLPELLPAHQIDAP